MRTPEQTRAARIRAAMRAASRQGCDPYNSHSAYAKAWQELARRWGWR